MLSDPTPTLPVRLVALLAVVFSVLLGPGADAAPPDPDLLAGLAARSIGPAGMSGRVTAIDVSPAAPKTLWVGTASGGVWTSRDAGVTFAPVFDDQLVHSIGDVAVHPRNGDLIWVGTGEGNPRNSVSVGDGVYLSRDGGVSWTHRGLTGTERIHRVVLHPDDPDVAWVCALGRLWGDGGERGVFKTTDGGESWNAVLQAGGKQAARTGCADLVVDPDNPDKLFAALWQFRRWPDFFHSGGPGSGLYRSHDGGLTWSHLGADDGLPEGELGRIGIAIAASDPRVVYALVEAEETVLVRSEDGGHRFEIVNDEPSLAARPFYYADLRVDPAWPNRIYLLDYDLRVSDDGGATVRILEGSGTLHGDHHALWIDPADPEHLVSGNDGGLGISQDHGRTFRFVHNLPIAQLYHVAVDQEIPYRIYGGMQDNGSWLGPSSVWQHGGIRNSHWRTIGDGDGFDARPVPGMQDWVYSMWQGGQLVRFNVVTGEERGLRPIPFPNAASRLTPLRFNWDAPLALDPFDDATLYLGSQLVHRSNDRGESWTVISPDLTTNDPRFQRQVESGGLTPDVTEAETHTTLTALAVSPRQRGLLWAGSDDGRLHVTRDGGASWTRLDERLPGATPGAWVTHLSLSPHRAETVFLALDDHRRDDRRPYVYRTDDGGESWRALVDPNTTDVDAPRGWAHVVMQDPVASELLYLGTEFGLWMSFDGGGEWMPFRQGLPAAASVIDLAVHPRDGDLVIATHGRGFYVVDDLGPLRALAKAGEEIALLEAPLHLFAPAPVRQHWRRPEDGDWGYGDDVYRGENRPYGALVTFSLAPSNPSPGQDANEESEPPEVTVEISEAGGKVVKTLRSESHWGINRVVWNLSREPFAIPPWMVVEDWMNADRGLEVSPGTYRATVRTDEHEATAEIEVIADPRSPNTAADWDLRWRSIERYAAFCKRSVEAIRRVRRTLDDIADVEERLRRQLVDRGVLGSAGVDGEKLFAEQELVVEGKILAERLHTLDAKLWAADDRRGFLPEVDVDIQLWYAEYYAFSGWQPPSANHLANLDRVETLLVAAEAEVEALFATEVAAYRAAVAAAGLGLLTE